MVDSIDFNNDSTNNVVINGMCGITINNEDHVLPIDSVMPEEASNSRVPSTKLFAEAILKSRTDIQHLMEIVENKSDDPIVLPFNNIALPRNPDHLNILALGNSFTETMYSNIIGMLSAAGISNVTLARTYNAGASLEEQIEWFDTKDAHREFFVSENLSKFQKVSDQFTIQNALSYAKWDIIIIHEKSERSGLTEYYDKFLPQYIRRIKSHPNAAGSKIAVQLTWALNEQSKYNYLAKYYNNDSKYMFECLRTVYKQLRKKFGIDLIIPNHLSFQNARNDAEIMGIDGINNLLTAAGLHPNAYGKYLASATFFQTIFSPIYGCSVLGNSYRTEEITEPYYKRLQACAALACSYSEDLIGEGDAPTVDEYISLVE